MYFDLDQLSLSENNVCYASDDKVVRYHLRNKESRGTELGVYISHVSWDRDSSRSVYYHHEDVLKEICQINNIDSKTVAKSPWDSFTRCMSDPWRFYKVNFNWDAHKNWSKSIIEERDLRYLEERLQYFSSVDLLKVVERRLKTAAK